MSRVTRSNKHRLEFLEDSDTKKSRQDVIDAATAILRLAGAADSADVTIAAAPTTTDLAGAAGAAAAAPTTTDLAVAATATADVTIAAEATPFSAACMDDEGDEVLLFEQNSELRVQVERLELNLERSERERSLLQASNADLTTNVVRLESATKTLAEERDTLQANLKTTTESLATATASADKLALELSATKSVLDFNKEQHALQDATTKANYDTSRASFESLQDTNAELLRANDEFNVQRGEARLAAAAATHKLEAATSEIANLRARIERQATRFREFREEAAQKQVELNEYKAANTKMLADLRQARAQTQQTVLENLAAAKAAGKAFASPEVDAVLSIKLALEDMTTQRDQARRIAQINCDTVGKYHTHINEIEAALKIAKSRISQLESESKLLRMNLASARSLADANAADRGAPASPGDRSEIDRLTQKLKAAQALGAAAESQLAAERNSATNLAKLRLHELRMKEIVHPSIIDALGVFCKCNPIATDSGTPDPTCPCKNFTLANTVAAIKKLRADLAAARGDDSAAAHPDDSTSFAEVARGLVHRAVHGFHMKAKQHKTGEQPFVPGTPLVVPAEGHVSATPGAAASIYAAANRATQWHNAVDAAALALGANIHNDAAATAFQSACETCFLADIAFAETLATISPKRLSIHRASNLIAHPDFRRALLATAHSPSHFAAVATAMAALTVDEHGPVDTLRLRCAGALKAMVARTISKANIAPEDDPATAAVNAVVALAASEATILPRITPLTGPVRPDSLE
jgi:hypothetical protein